MRKPAYADLSSAHDAGNEVLFSFTAGNETCDYVLWELDGISSFRSLTSFILVTNTENERMWLVRVGDESICYVSLSVSIVSVSTVLECECIQHLPWLGWFIAERYTENIYLQLNNVETLYILIDMYCKEEIYSRAKK